MEHEKKKRQKKKKNKQGKANEKPPSGVAELISENYNHALVNNQYLNSENTDRESISGAETSHSIDVENSYSLNIEASLQQKIKELQEQLEVHVLREADLERNILHSQKEINLLHHRETEFETRIQQLQSEKDSLLQKENSSSEIIASLNKDNARLQSQVMELEASKNNMKQHMSDLQSKILDLEKSLATHISSEKTKRIMEDEEMNTKLESARALIEKLVSENEKLIEKVNYLNTELDQKSGTNSENDETSASATETDPMVPSSSAEKLPSDHGMVMESMKNDVIRLKSSNNNSVNDFNRVSMESGEIVQISLDENDGLVPTMGSDPVPLMDAPLIGAPFRFISLVARYVSGADLVEKS